MLIFAKSSKANTLSFLRKSNVHMQKWMTYFLAKNIEISLMSKENIKGNSRWIITKK